MSEQKYTPGPWRVVDNLIYVLTESRTGRAMLDYVKGEPRMINRFSIRVEHDNRKS
jgi:hypothetical protein